jgi:hypothetical protein
MPRKPIARVVRSVTDRLWERDRLQMRAADALLAVFEGRAKPRRRPTAIKTRRRKGRPR